MHLPGSVFHFREFNLLQSDGVWKTGTDSVLLGGWCDADGVKSALDVGTGTGILALILAQRYPGLRIDAIDSNPSAVEIAWQNVQASAWAQRIQVRQEDILDLTASRDRFSYELIISNPPYFPSGMTSTEKGRREARQGRGFSIYNIASCANSLLCDHGKLVIVSPYAETHDVIRNANATGLYVRNRMDVRNTASSEYALSFLAFTRGLVPVRRQELTLYDAGTPTLAYRELCGALYSSPMFSTGRS